MAKIKRKYKTVVQRCASAFIDGVLLSPIAFLLHYITKPGDPTAYVLSTAFYYCIVLAYQVYMHGKYGQTLGKMASSVKVYSFDEKSLITYRAAFLREIIWVSITFIGLIYVLFAKPLTNDPDSDFTDITFYPSLLSTFIEVCTMYFNPKRRALHDLIAGSVVLDITKYRKWDIEYEDSLQE